MSGQEQDYIQKAFDSNWIAPLGPNVDAFEKEIAKYVGASGAVGVSSGTAAIHLALLLLDVKKGDRIFCSSLTFVASANPILYQGAEPVFIDSEPETWNMSPPALRRALEDADRQNNLPKAVIIVNLYGQVAKMKELLELCDEYEVPVIEDAAESLGSSYFGKRSGNFGKYSIFSFNGNKIITTSGGGMLVSNHEDDLKKARFFATQAKDPALHYQHSQMGYNYRLSNILAGMGRAQVEVLNQRVSQRRKVFSYYQQKLGGLSGIEFMPELKNTFSNRWLSVLTVDPEVISIPQIINELEKENIEARPVWKPLHLQPLFEGKHFYSHGEEGMSVSEKLFNNGICLPSGSNLTQYDQDKVISCVKRCLLTVSAVNR
ncbi:aminotransferase class I/II-fold pyridoxal phosphate-dependent enzyme [Fictibacillus sp. NE201]|uniref:Aminotransferase class I/II-fold pyridoxal phosphate-dependent enzyme n=2 Tax=Fictibacillus fluitans TaxID=3058422 RepID=A0ABT8I132_9BACL|nr:aminotransferase class I/II-fold pyridoxal phosphate-dependent enzyme [Fictibacillus sp. NE201]MDN4526726.1 aminotransferase class I/II-fold pyridoxal phosphate-dependent enzyme [Fictibacillus sp. NE201]